MCKLDFAKGSVLVVHGDSFHRVKCRINTVNDFAKDSVFAIKMWLLCIGNEELGLVGVGPRVGHCNDTPGVELGVEQCGSEEAGHRPLSASL